MSYLFIVIIGAITGWVAGQFFKTDDTAVLLDAVAGAIGASGAVLLSRLVGPAAASGFAMSAIVAIAGAFGVLYAMRRYMRPQPLPVTRHRRR